MEVKNKITPIGVVFIIYVTLVLTIKNPVILYGGYGVLISSVLIKLLFYDQSKLHFFSKSKKLALFYLYCILSVFWAYSTDYVYTQIPLLIACTMLVIFMTDYFVKKEEVSSILWALACAGIGLAIYVIVSYGGLSQFYSAATKESYSLEAQRLGSDITNVNVIGMQCGFATIILFYFALFKKYKLCYLLMLIPFITAAASGSRKALILLIGGIVLVTFHYMSRGSTRQKYLNMFFGVILLFLGLMLLLSMDIMQTAIGRLQQSVNLFSGSAKAADGTSQLRLEMIITGLKRFWNEPVLGYGLGNSRVVNRIFVGFEAYSHNDYIENLLNGGIVGFLMYYGTIIRIIREYLLFMKIDDDPDLRISFYILILFMFMNIAAVSYYGSITTYVYFILWITQLELKKKEHPGVIADKPNQTKQDLNINDWRKL